MDEVAALGFWQYGLFGWIFGDTGVVGLLLAAVGVYGVLSYAVSQRTPEIGVRMALGAERGDVLRLIVGHGCCWPASASASASCWRRSARGSGGRSSTTSVHSIPLTFGAVAVFLLVVAALASYIPALRATRVDPVQALRGE